MKDKETLKKEFSCRLKEIQRYYNLSGRGFSEKLGQHSATVNNYINGLRTPPLEFFVAVIETYPEISSDWLLLGKGDMFNKTNPDVEKLKEELHDLKMTVLVKEGIIKELHDNILEELRKRNLS